MFYFLQSTQEELWADCGFDKNAIVATVKKLVGWSESSNNLTEKAV